MKLLSALIAVCILVCQPILHAAPGEITVDLQVSPDQASWSNVAAYPVEDLDVSVDEPYYRASVVPVDGGDPVTTSVVQATTANPAKLVDVVLESSPDLADWSPDAPGVVDVTTGKKFFQVRIADAITAPPIGEMVLVPAGTIDYLDPDLIVADPFYIGAYEVTLGEWETVVAWALVNGYTISELAGLGCATDHPVHTISWVEAVTWCNALSENEGLDPVYTYDYLEGTDVYRGDVAIIGVSELNVDTSKNGYRLPSNLEFEFAARGGASSPQYTYAGSDVIDDVAWYQLNSLGAACGDTNTRGTWPVGLKQANFLGLYDMSGNILEWGADGPVGVDVNRYQLGGAYLFVAVFCQPDTFSFQTSINSRAETVGFRVARTAPAPL